MKKHVRTWNLACAFGCVTALVLGESGTARAESPLPSEPDATVTVHIRSSLVAELRRRPRGTATFSFACSAPCDEPMPMLDDYILVAGSTTRTVSLVGRAGDTVVLDVTPADDAKKILGAAMIGFGAVGFILGGAIDVGGLIMRQHDTGSGDVTLGVGLAITGVGLALGIGGGAVVSNASSPDVSEGGTGTASRRGAHPDVARS